jgi:acetylornithine deacetylase/succinyl-diaminopimelate desuccinylase-like protein
MADLERALAYARAHRDQHLAQFKEVLHIPSISTLPEHKEDVRAMARWLVEELQRLGMAAVELVETPGHPVVYAEWLAAPGKPTILVYGHYDVQPVDPVDEWESSPFEGAVRGDYIFARGASDMKGQWFGFLKAVESLVQHGALPVNLKFMIEGEEEIGSPNLDAFIDENKERLACDAVVNCDAGIQEEDLPAIVYALRGLAYFEIHVRGPKKDLHSGMYGGSIANPGQVLCELIAGMHDAQGRVALPGFYDKVRALDDDERQTLARIPYSDDDWLRHTGAPALWGETGFSTIERVGARPTLEVNGLLCGFTGTGSKTVLPARAMAKISMRLVPDQEPEDVYPQLMEYMKQHAPDTVEWQVQELNSGPGAVMARDSDAMKAAVKALTEVFGKTPLFKREGGSVPVVALLQRKLGVDSVMLGFALPTDGIHGPNERQHLPNFFRGIETYIRFLHNL